MKTEWTKPDPNRDKISSDDRPKDTPSLVTQQLKSQLLTTFNDKISSKTPFVETLSIENKSYTCLGCVTENGQYQCFVLDKELARGGEGVIYKAQNVMNASWTVVKAIDAFEQPQEFVHPEYRALKKLHRAVGLVNVKPTEPYYLIMPFYSGKPLIEYMYELDGRFSKEDARHFRLKRELSSGFVMGTAYHLVNELIKIEEAGLIHRDITPWNIIATDKTLHVVDYGGAITRGSPRSASVGTLGYVPPEVDKPKLMPQGLMDTTYDRFSLGVILAEMLSENDFQAYRIAKNEDIRASGTRRQLTLDEIKAGMPDIFDEAHIANQSKQYKAMVHIIHELLNENPSQRLDLRKMRYQLSTHYQGDILSNLSHRLGGFKSLVAYELDEHSPRKHKTPKPEAQPSPKREGDNLKPSARDNITHEYKKRLVRQASTEEGSSVTFKKK